MSLKEHHPHGRGAGIHTHNVFESHEYGQFEEEGIDENEDSSNQTTFLSDRPKKIVNKVNSPDLRMDYSMNPYQGCEHGCVYCYARNSHQYWGLNAGLDFERKIIIKENAALALEKQLKSKNWKVHPMMLAGNTDCYQPIERKKKITRELLEVCLKYKHPVGIITKNDLVLRDLDLLKELNKDKLINVSISLTTLDEKLRRKLEPRTSTAANRLKTIRELSGQNIPVNVMLAPIIPSLNSNEIPQLLKAASENGAIAASFTVVRLNGVIAEIFKDWLHKEFPDKAEKILHQIEECHDGKLNDSRIGKRIQGDGQVAASIKRLFQISKQKYFGKSTLPDLNTKAFISPTKSQLSLW